MGEQVPAEVEYRVTSDGNAEAFEKSSAWQHMITDVDFVEYAGGNAIHDFLVLREYAEAFERLLDDDSTVISYKQLDRLDY